jgi:tetratricopeptide (TPR) repeat protein
MNEIGIKEAADLLKTAKENNSNLPIIFLNKNMPIEGFHNDSKLIADLLLSELRKINLKSNLKDERIPKDELLWEFSPEQRNSLIESILAEYDLSTFHINLIHFLESDFVDLVFTLNFNDFPSDGASFYCLYPPMQYITRLKRLMAYSTGHKVTLAFDEYHGVWFNTSFLYKHRLASTVPKIFDDTYFERPWIFIGYEDKELLVDYLSGLFRYDYGLFWGGENKRTMSKTMGNILELIDSNAFFVKNRGVQFDLNELSKLLNINQKISYKDYYNFLPINPNEYIEEDKSKVFSIHLEKINVDIIENQIGNMLYPRNFDDQKLERFRKKALRIKDKNLNVRLERVYYRWAYDLTELTFKKENTDNFELYYQAFEKYEKAASINGGNFDIYFNWGNLLGNLAEKMTGNDVDDLYQRAFDKYECAYKFKPKNYNNLLNWGTDLGKYAQVKKGLESEELFNKAVEVLGKAVKHERLCYVALFNWSIFLKGFAESQSLPESKRLYILAVEKLELAISKNLNHPDTYITLVNTIKTLIEISEAPESNSFYNLALEYLEKAVSRNKRNPELYKMWSNLLVDMSKSKDDDEAKKLLTEAYEKFKKASLIDPRDFKVLSLWGIALEHMAHLCPCGESEKWYIEAIAKYKKVISMKPDSVYEYYLWGNALFGIAECKDGTESEKWYRQSISKFEKALELKPDFTEALALWGLALVNISKNKNRSAAELLHNEAFEMFFKALKIDGTSYYLSCLYSIRREKSEALKYAEMALINNEVTASDIIDDVDWSWMSEDSDFKALMTKFDI